MHCVGVCWISLLWICLSTSLLPNISTPTPAVMVDNSLIKNSWVLRQYRVMHFPLHMFATNIYVNPKSRLHLTSVQLYCLGYQICIRQGSYTSQIRKFKGISRVIKGSTAYFQGYFWKTVVNLLYVNTISSNFSVLFNYFLVYAVFYGGINNFPKIWLMTERDEM